MGSDAALAKRSCRRTTTTTEFQSGRQQRPPPARRRLALAALTVASRLELLAAHADLCARERHPAAMLEGVRERGLRAGVRRL